MSVKIRLKRVGAKNTPIFRVVVTDGRNPRDGRFIEEIGTYTPTKKQGVKFEIQLDRADYWIGVGAQPSETVSNMIKKARISADAAPAEAAPTPEPAAAEAAPEPAAEPAEAAPAAAESAEA